MHSALRHFIQAICGLTLLAIISAAQQPATQPATGIIQGRVTLDKAPQPGVIVMLVASQERGDLNEMFGAKPAPTVVTDGEGRFQFTKVKAGKFHLQVHMTVDVAGEDINISDGETVDHQDFDLRRGGVITGKVIDPEGHPVIEASISLSLVHPDTSRRGHSVNGATQTDDRGIFRLFGLGEGQYKVSASLNAVMGGFFNIEPEFRQTYYPSAATDEEAKLVSVRSETETSGIEITLLRAEEAQKKGVTVSGRVFMDDTLKAVAGSMLMLMPTGEAAKNPRPTAPTTSNGNGEFRFEGVSAGDYLVTLVNMQEMMMGTSTGYADPLKVTVADSAVAGLEIKMQAGASLSGIVALETKAGTRPDATQLEQLSTLMIMATPDRDAAQKPDDSSDDIASAMGGFGMATVKPDQTFIISGLRSGRYKLQAESMTGKKLKILRIERNGAVAPFIELQGTEPVKGLRLVFALGSAAIKGRVQVQGGTLPTGSSFSIMVSRQGENRPDERDGYTQSDGRGNFSLDGLLPGTYEIKVMSVRAQGEGFVFDYEMPAQTLTLLENATQEVVLYVNLVKKEKQ